MVGLAVGESDGALVRLEVGAEVGAWLGDLVGEGVCT